MLMAALLVRHCTWTLKVNASAVAGMFTQPDTVYEVLAASPVRV